MACWMLDGSTAVLYAQVTCMPAGLLLPSCVHACYGALQVLLVPCAVIRMDCPCVTTELGAVRCLLGQLADADDDTFVSPSLGLDWILPEHVTGHML
jgi:hypothetical protein